MVAMVYRPLWKLVAMVAMVAMVYLPLWKLNETQLEVNMKVNKVVVQVAVLIGV